MQDRSAPVSLLLRSALLLLGLSLAGCQDALVKTGGSDVQVTLPTYAPGTVIVHESGATERLISNGLGVDVWETDSGRRFGRTTNFIAPYAFSESSRRSYSQRVSFGNPDKIWPLGRGAGVRFGVERIYEDGRTIQRLWRCRDKGLTSLTFRGKAEDTIKVSCTVYRPGLTKNYRRLSKEYFYSPRLERLLLVVTTDLRKRNTKREDWYLAKLDRQQATNSNIERIISRGLAP